MKRENRAEINSREKYVRSRADTSQKKQENKLKSKRYEVTHREEEKMREKQEA